ncbi:hypothetical protein E2562_037388 [Oryza meyeriana var. granulata]|uniref:Uncharacterized protein n=1 Tax=Oryza meyeriana var. granulata TaxID=110450 RepID=A0A6G1E7V5_9ORYZ|nr:hypothetical protein E2562_037388 [Oryza meyeriana var. granulata]
MRRRKERTNKNPKRRRQAWNHANREGCEGFYLGLGPVKPYGEPANGRLLGVRIVFFYFLVGGLRASSSPGTGHASGPVSPAPPGLRRPPYRLADSTHWPYRCAPRVAVRRAGAAMEVTTGGATSGDSGSEGACLLILSPADW